MQRLVAILASLAFAVSAFAGDPGPTRPEVEAEVTRLAAEFETNPDSAVARFRYAQALHKGSHFWRAHAVIRPLLEVGDTPDGALPLAAELAYLIGHYEKAEKLNRQIISGDDSSARIMAMVNLALTHYQQNRFDEIRAIDFPQGVQLPNLAPILKQFVDGEIPYALEWAGDERISRIPFIVTDNLPVLTVSVNGVPLAVLFDTGADQLIIDSEIADALGVDPVATATGSFGGGKQGEIGFGKVDRVKLGSVLVRSVPVTIMPTKRFSSDFTEGKFVLGGIIGTAFMRQFLGTLDYKNEQLVLRERNPVIASEFRAQSEDRIVGEIPFALSATHWMMVKGAINGVDGMTFWVDSGLGGGRAKFTAPIQTLEYLGIPEPETDYNPTSSGGGGGTWKSGEFTVQSIGMGDLQQGKSIGEYGALPPEHFLGSGFIQDALISHMYLRQYASWTLDFDNMRYMFTK